LTTEDPPKSAAQSALLSGNKAKKTRGPRKRVSESSIDRALRSGKLPHEVLLQASRTGKLPVVGANGKRRERSISSHQQLFAASAAAPFFAPKLSAVQVSPPPPPKEPLGSWESLDSTRKVEIAKRFAFVIAEGAHIAEQRRQQGHREPLLLEGKSSVIEPVPVYSEIDRRPKRAVDPLQALDQHRNDLERVKEDSLHVTAGERGRSGRGRQQAITGRPPLTGWRGR
jgi:hypothetical protein